MSIRRAYGTKDLYLASVLYDSIEDNNLSAVKILLEEKKANPNILVPKRGISPFHLAIGNDCPTYAYNVTVLVLQHGGNPNVRSLDALTPVHIAAAWGRFDILKLLINYGGDPYQKDINCMSAIDYAIEQNQDEITRYFSENFPLIDLSVLSDREELNPCDLVLDKVLVDHGELTGEYKVDETVNEVQTSELQQLPKTNTEEYVLNWIGNTVSPDGKLELKLEELLSGHTDSEDTEPNKNRFINVTQRRRYKVSPRRCLPIKNSLDNSLDSSTRRRKKVVHHLESSRESGILTLPESSYDSRFNTCLLPASDVEGKCSSVDNSVSSRIKVKDTSSDYFTCTDVSEVTNAFEKNIFEVSSDKSLSLPPNSSILTSDRSVGLPNTTNMCNDKLSDFEKTFVSVSEIYKYLDPDEGIVLYEKRLLVSPTKNLNESINSAITSQSSKVSSLPQHFDYDTDTLRKELIINGLEPGPITKTTKRIYLKKLYKMKKYPTVLHVQEENTRKVYSKELEKTIKNPDLGNDLMIFKDLELTVANQFSSPDPTRKWREGVNKSSFNYLLLDPRVTQNLPCRADMLTKQELWETFLSAIFYVGKGKRSRPYSHLYEAVSLWNSGSRTSSNKKLQHILDIWSDNSGVICLHVFQNVIPVEAYTREAAMISALKLENLRNAKSGDFYGHACTWSPNQKRMFGVYLLYRAMHIFVQEGERQLSPNDID